VDGVVVEPRAATQKNASYFFVRTFTKTSLLV
jgi:hypothetical protein